LTKIEDMNGLTLLGKSEATFSGLETFPNRNPQRNYTVTLTTDEFTCVCPLTGQPDFARITITYVPDQRIVESKSLKLYFFTYRNRGVFHEHAANLILTDLVKVLEPRWCRVEADFGVRGGIAIRVSAQHGVPPQ